MRTFVGNGKQALALIARALRAGGVGTVLVPRYRCETMVLPFALEGMRARPVDVGADLLADPRALREALAREPGAAVLHCETYGNRGGRELASVLGAARGLGHPVVLDATHSVVDRLIGAPPPANGSPAGGGAGPGAGAPGWDAVVASARKLLPVPDGAWLAWPDASPLAARLARAVAILPGRRPADERAAALGAGLGRALEAMRAARGGRREELRLEACRIAARHEAAIESALTPVPASARTVALLEGLGPRGLRPRARAARRLRERLDAGLRARGLRVVNPVSAGCVALGAAGPDGGTAGALGAVEEVLARAGLWGPVSWSDPDAGARAWPSVVTVPTDEPGRVEELVGLVGAALDEG